MLLYFKQLKQYFNCKLIFAAADPGLPKAAALRIV
jgi:hypothetical protein